MSKNLSFKLILDGDSQGLISALKQPEQAAKALFETIKSEAEKVRIQSEKTAKELNNIVPKSSSELADKLSQSLNAATSIIKDAGDNAKATASNFTDFGNKAEKALNTLKSDLISAQQKLKDFSSTSASPADIERAQVEVDALEKEIQQADQAFNNFHQEVGRANVKLSETDSASTKAKQGLDGVKFATNALIGAMAALGVGLGIRELADTADSYTNLSARINIATKEGGDFTSAMAGVHLVALQTNSSLQSTGDLFTRLNTVGKEMGMTQQQALDLTKTVTQAIQIGGGSAQASEAAVTQFIQAMQGGVLRGEEFNSIMESGYGLAEALAKGLGVTTGELRKMAENGELSTERVISAVQSQASEVQKTYDQFPVTIANALQKIATSWQIVIGEMDQANGSSATVANALIVVADNLGIIKVFLDDVGLGFISLSSDLQDGIDASAIDAFKNAISAAYDVIKDLVSTVYELGSSVFNVLSTSLSNVSSLFSSLTGNITRAGEEVGFLERMFQGTGIALGVFSDGFTGIKIALSLLTGGFFSLASAANSVMAALTWGDVSKQFAENSDLMKDKAKQYYAEADREAQEFQSKAIKRLKEAAQTENEKNIEAVASSKAKLDQLLAHQKEEVIGKKVTETQKIEAVKAYAEAAIAANKGAMDGVVQADLLTKGYIVTLDEARDVGVETWSKTEEGANKAGVSVDKARKGAIALGLDLDVSLNKVSAKFKENETSIDNFVAGLKGLGVEGKQAGEVTYEAWQKWLETAKSQAEVDFAKAKLKEFGDQGKISTSQVEMGMQAIRQVVQKLPADIDPVTAAFERLGIKTKEQLALAAQSALADFNTIQSSGQATAESLKQAYERTMQAAAASGDQAVIASTQAKAASLGLQVQVDQTGKATVTSMDDLSSSVDRVGRSFNGLKGHARSAGEVMREEARSSTEEWASALEALDGGMRERTQGTRARMAYNADMIAESLKAQGYDDARAQKLAEEIYESSRTADGKAYKQVGNKWSFVGGGGGMSNGDFVNKQLDYYSQYADTASSSLRAPSAPAIPTTSNEAAKTVEYKFMLGGKEVSLYGSPNDGNAMEEMLRELEMLKRGS